MNSMISRLLFFGQAIAVAGGSVGLLGRVEQRVPEEVVILQYRSASQNCAGAAQETKDRIVSTFGRALLLQSIDVKSAVVEGGFNRGSFIRDSDGSFGITDGDFLIRTGFWVRDCGKSASLGSDRTVLSGIGEQPPSSWPNSRWTGRSYSVVSVRKSYQDLPAEYRLWLPPSVNIDNFRIGQKVSFSGKILGADGTRIYVFVDAVTPETTMLRCPNGHEYAPAAGYRFCPIDGLPIKGGAD